MSIRELLQVEKQEECSICGASVSDPDFHSKKGKPICDKCAKKYPGMIGKYHGESINEQAREINDFMFALTDLTDEVSKVSLQDLDTALIADWERQLQSMIKLLSKVKV
jgi:recombinational DNA repair protein (RecF pathway)